MVIIGVILGVVWLLLLAVVVAICRAAGRADAREERLGRPDAAWPAESVDRPAATAGGARPRFRRRVSLRA